jgi:hypothetical protein
MEKGSSQSYDQLVASWNSREGIETSGRMSDDLERHHYERWMGSRNSSNPPILTGPIDAWFARSLLETGPRKPRKQTEHDTDAMPPTIGERSVDRSALVSNLQALMEVASSTATSADPEEVRKMAGDALELLEQYDGVLRNLCMFLSAGGWNSEGLIDPVLADKKIRWGIDNMFKIDWPKSPNEVK